MKLSFIFLIYFVLLQSASTIETVDQFKSIDLCPEKTPSIANEKVYNNDKMRDIMAQAALAYEIRNNRTDRMPVGKKTPVLGTLDHVTDTGHDAGMYRVLREQVYFFLPISRLDLCGPKFLKNFP